MKQFINLRNCCKYLSNPVSILAVRSQRIHWGGTENYTSTVHQTVNIIWSEKSTYIHVYLLFMHKKTKLNQTLIHFINLIHNYLYTNIFRYGNYKSFFWKSTTSLWAIGPTVIQLETSNLIDRKRMLWKSHLFTADVIGLFQKMDLFWRLFFYFSLKTSGQSKILIHIFSIINEPEGRTGVVVEGLANLFFLGPILVWLRTVSHSR